MVQNVQTCILRPPQLADENMAPWGGAFLRHLTIVADDLLLFVLFSAADRCDIIHILVRVARSRTRCAG